MYERITFSTLSSLRKLVSDWQGKENEDAVAVINWVANTLQTELGKILKVVGSSYARGRIDSLKNTKMAFHVAGEISNIITPLVDKILTAPMNCAIVVLTHHSYSIRGDELSY